MPRPVSHTCRLRAAPRAAAADEHAAAFGVAHRVARRCCARCAPPAPGRCARRPRSGASTRRMPLRRGLGAWSAAHALAASAGSAKVGDAAATMPASSREMSSSAVEQAVQRLDRAVEVLDQALRLGVHAACAQRADEHAQRVHRLAQVVAGRGQEARLGDVGLFGQRLLALHGLEQVDVLEAQAQRGHQVGVEAPAQQQEGAAEDETHQRQRLVQRVAARRAPQHEGQHRRHHVGPHGGQPAAEGRHRARRGGRDEQHDDQLLGGVGRHQPARRRRPRPGRRTAWRRCTSAPRRATARPAAAGAGTAGWSPGAARSRRRRRRATGRRTRGVCASMYSSTPHSTSAPTRAMFSATAAVRYSVRICSTCTALGVAARCCVFTGGLHAHCSGRSRPGAAACAYDAGVHTSRHQALQWLLCRDPDRRPAARVRSTRRRLAPTSGWPKRRAFPAAPSARARAAHAAEVALGAQPARAARRCCIRWRISS